MKNLLKISDFSIYAKISRKLLIFYDKEKILSPRYISQENGYRYYDVRQIDTANVIVALRRIGTPLNIIRNYLNARSPRDLIRLLEDRETELEAQIQELSRIRGMIHIRKTQIQEGLTARMGEIYIADCPEENLFIGPHFDGDFDFTQGWRGLPTFYDACIKSDIPLGFAFGSIIETNSTINKNQRPRPAYFFYRLPADLFPQYYKKPAGRYVIVRDRIDYEQIHVLYQRALNYIDKENLTICGNAYAEHLIDELSSENINDYVLQIAVPIQ